MHPSDYIEPLDIVREIFSLQRKIEASFDAASGLSLTEFFLLQRMNEVGGELAQSKLVAAPETPNASSLSSAMKNLEKRKLISRERRGKEIHARMTGDGLSAFVSAKQEFNKSIGGRVPQELSGLEHLNYLKRYRCSFPRPKYEAQWDKSDDLPPPGDIPFSNVCGFPATSSSQ